jgi:hypothetical protein
MEYTYTFGASEQYQSYLAAGSGPNNLQQRTAGDGIVAPTPENGYTGYIVFTSLVTGFDGEVVGHARFSGEATLSTTIVFVEPGTLEYTIVGTSEYGPGQLRSGTEMLYSWGQNVGRSANYRTTLPSAVIAGGGSVAICQAGIFCGNRTGIAQITNFDTTPQVSVVAAASVNVGKIIAGSRRRGVAAQGGSTIYALNGDGQWTAIEVPSGLSVAVMGMVEPI